MQDFDFDSWTPPTSPMEQDDREFTDWLPPTRPIRGASGLGDEFTGPLPPLASETKKEEFPFTGPMPFSLRENPNRPQSLTPTDEYSRVLDRVSGVAKGTADIFGQPYDRPGSPKTVKLSIFGNEDDNSVLPEYKQEPDTYAGGVAKSLWNEYGRWAANPGALIGSMEAGPAKAVTKLTDILKIGESPAAKLAKGALAKGKSLYNKAKTDTLTKTPADVAALEAQLRGTLSEPFRPGALETGPVAKVDLSTGIPKPRIDAATFAQMRDARAMEASRAEQATNAARVAPDPQASVATRPLAGMNPQPRPTPRPTPKIDVNPRTGELEIPGVNAPIVEAPPIVETPAIEAMPETAIPEVPEAPITFEQSLVESPIEAPPLESMPEPIDIRDFKSETTNNRIDELYKKIGNGVATRAEVLEAEQLVNELAGPTLGTSKIDLPEIKEPGDVIPFRKPEPEVPPVEAMPEEAPVPQEQSLAVPERAIEPEVMPIGTNMGEEELDMFGYPKSRDLTDEEVETIKRQIMKNESQYFGPDMVENQEAADAMTGNIEVMPEETKKIVAEIVQAGDEGYAVYPPGYKEKIHGTVIRELSDGSKVVDNAPRALPEAPPSISAMPEESPWVGEAIEEAPKPKTKAELKAERIAAKKAKKASKWAGVSKPSEGPAKLLTREEVGPAIESMPKETPTPRPTKVTPIEEMPIGSLPGEEGITEGIITSQDKADFRAREEEMRKALEGKTRASETGVLEERPSWISEEGEEIGVPPEDKETSRAKAEEMKRALEGKKRAGSRMSMPEMGRTGELPKVESMPKETPTPPKPTETPLLRSKNFKERLKGEKGAAIISGKGPGPFAGGPNTPPPSFSWKSPGSKSSGIGSKGPLDVMRESKLGKAIGKAYEESGGGFVGGLEVIGNAMKSAMSTGDLSAPFRQGAALVHKKEFRQNLPKMIDMFKDEAAFTKHMNDIKSHPNFKFADKMGLDLPGLNRGKEERFANEVIESIPGYGKVTRASDRAYTGFLNKTRFDTFNSLLQDAVNAGLAPGRDKELAKEIATFVNEATGRGSLGRFEPASRFLNATIYSPKLGMSRLQMINRVVNPYMYAKQSAFVRKEALKSAFSLAGMNLTTNALTAMVGGKVTYDILNSDFAKNKFGNTRVDFGAGFLQPLVLAARIAADKYTSSTSGKTYDLGTNYGQTSTEDLLKRFLVSKEAPIAGLVSDLWSGKDWQGKPKNRAIAIGERFTPLILQDMYDIIKEDPRMAPLIVPGFFGASVQTYGKPEKKMKLSMPKMGVGF